MQALVETLTQQRSVRSESRFCGKHVHFIGIGGCGMSGLARILMDAGAIVTGSDTKLNAPVLELIRHGAKVSRDQLGEYLHSGADLVVRSAAVKDDNPEFAFAKARGLANMKYAQLLGEIMQERFGVAIAGTHGKSTTTGMVAYAMTACGESPSWVVGGTVSQLGGGSASGKGEAFVVEACEFDRSFHNLHPSLAVITNIEADHLDCYKDIADIIESFRHFVSLVPPEGMVICNGTDENVAQAVAGATCNVQTVAIDAAATWTARPTGIVNGCHSADILQNGQPVASVQLSIPGLHNLFDATMAIATCVACGVPAKAAAAAVSAFTGVDRRMAQVGFFNEARIMDDYGHHPTEIRATLRAVRERYQPTRLFCVFQPHQHSRTRLLLEGFSTCFEDADRILVPDIYKCRDSESDVRAINAAGLVEKIRANDRDAVYLPKFEQITEYLKQHVGPGDVVITMGAGNVCDIAKELAAL